MAHKSLAECRQFGGMFCVIHSDRKSFTNRVSDYVADENDAESIKSNLTSKYPAEQLHVHKLVTLEEMQASRRKVKAHTKLDVSYFQVVRDRQFLRGGEVATYRGYPEPEMFGGRFKAVRALRNLRKSDPSARLVRATFYYSSSDDMNERSRLLRQIIR